MGLTAGKIPKASSADHIQDGYGVVTSIGGVGADTELPTEKATRDALNLKASTTHAANHTNGTDDIQNATAAQKGLATAAQITKLDGIEALADVTDATNVAAAGAIMTTTIDAKGDILAGTGDNALARVAIGANDTVLAADSVAAPGVAWKTLTALGAVAKSLFTAKGSIVAASAATTPTEVTVGANDTVLAADSVAAPGVAWKTLDTLGAIVKSLLTTKGDIIVATGAATPVRLGVGTDGQIIVADNSQSAGIRWATSALTPTKRVFIPAEYSANYNNMRARAIAATGSYRFNFNVPGDMVTLTSLELVGIPVSGAGGTGKDIDLTSNYGAIGESATIHTESDTTSTYNLGTDNNIISYSIASVFTNLAAGDFCGVFVDHKGIGGTVNYLGIRLIYST